MHPVCMICMCIIHVFVSVCVCITLVCVCVYHSCVCVCVYITHVYGVPYPAHDEDPLVDLSEVLTTDADLLGLLS